MTEQTNNPHGVAKGQVWADNDKRMAGREITIVEVSDTHASGVDGAGKPTKVRLDRFKPTSTGWRRLS